MHSSRLTTTAVFLILAVTLHAHAVDPVPTQNEIEQAYAQKLYPQALQMLAKALPLKGDAARGIDRHAMLRLKGEILLRQKAHAESAIAFDDASDETKDAKAAALDDATSVLVKRSSNGGYTPKTKDHKPTTEPAKPIDMIEPGSRKQAFRALFDDVWTTDQAAITTATTGKALPPVLEVVTKARDLHALELAATGADEKTGKLVATLGTHAKKLLDDALLQMEQRTESIKTKATDYVEVKETKPATKTTKAATISRWKERGLGSGDSEALQETLATTQKIDPACASLAKAFPQQKPDWASAKSKADQLRKLAQSVLSANYNKVSDKKPKA